jgi:hypothetical protein
MRFLQFSRTRTRVILLAITALAIAAAFGLAGSTSAAVNVAPKSTAPPTISGSAKLGSTLTATRGTFSGSTPIKYAYQWRRCDAAGGSCSDIDKAVKSTYTLAQIDVGNSMRVVSTGTNSDGSASGTSVPTAVVTAPVGPPATGCPSGTGGIAIADLSLPARLNIDGQTISPSVLRRSTNQITVRLHVTACGSRPVSGAMVYVTAVPFNQFSIAAATPTGTDGWASVTMSKLSGYPAAQHQQLLAMFAKASKSSDPELGGVSTRRLISFPVKLNG